MFNSAPKLRVIKPLVFSGLRRLPLVKKIPDLNGCMLNRFLFFNVNFFKTSLQYGRILGKSVI